MRAKTLVLTTQGSLYGLRLLNSLERAKSRPDAIVLRRSSLPRQLRLLRSVAKRLGWPDAVAAAWIAVQTEKQIHRALSASWRGSPLVLDYLQLSDQVIEVDEFNSVEGLTHLRALDADFFFLAQTGIVKDSVIQCAKKGVLNAHPGLLPAHRGIDVPWWNLAEGRPDQLGSSLHFVDVGVDTGPIVEVRPFRGRVKPSFELLEDRLYEDCIDLLTEAALKIAAGQALNKTPQSRDQGRQYYKIPSSTRKMAKENYRAWKLE